MKYEEAVKRISKLVDEVHALELHVREMASEPEYKNELQTELHIPRDLSYLIGRPLQHHVISRTPHSLVVGLLTFEFDQRIFRQDIEVPCEPRNTLTDRYAQMVQEKIKKIQIDLDAMIAENYRRGMAQERAKKFQLDLDAMTRERR